MDRPLCRCQSRATRACPPSAVCTIPAAAGATALSHRHRRLNRETSGINAVGRRPVVLASDAQRVLSRYQPNLNPGRNSNYPKLA